MRDDQVTSKQRAGETMAKSRTTDRPERRERAERPATGNKVRIDQPHTSSSSREGRKTAPLPEVEIDDAAIDAAAGLANLSEEQVLTQAAQLASLLQQRLRDLDRREANINANTAKLEAETRSARLALTERETNCVELETELQTRERDLTALLQEREQKCVVRERDAEHREQELRTIDEQLREREKRLGEALARLQEETEGVENARRSLQADRAAMDDELRTERRILAEDRERMLAEIQQEREALLHEIEVTREQDQQRLEQHQMDMLADVERQRQEVFEQREQLDKTRAVFEQERSVWVVARTGGTPEAFDLAQERLQLEKDRSAFSAERRRFETVQGELVAELEHRQKEIDNLRNVLANQPAVLTPEQIAQLATANSNSIAQPNPPPSEVITATAVESPAPVAKEKTEITNTERVAAVVKAIDPPPVVPMPGVSLLELAEQRSRLDEATAFLEREAEELDRLRLKLAEDQAHWKKRFQEQQSEIARREKAAELEIEGRKTKLIAREKTLDQQLTSVEQTRQEILRVHRESLEMRLVAEELWAQVAGRVPPAEVSQSIAKLRGRLASQYKVENQQLTSKKQQLIDLSERLNQQHDALLRQRRELQAWAAARQLEIEQQAERLVKREVELDQQQQAFAQQERQWEAEVRKLQQDLRRMVISRETAGAA